MLKGCVNMLDSKSKQILSFLKPYALQNSAVDVSSKDIEKNIPNLNLNEIKTALDYLEESGYLTLDRYIGCPLTVGKVTHKGISFEEFETQQITPSQTFNVQTVHNSAFGNNGNTTINNGCSLDEIRSLIAFKPAEDQEDLNKLVNTVEVITQNSETVSKGFLGKFSDLLAKHSDIAIAIGNNIMTWLTTH